MSTVDAMPDDDWLYVEDLRWRLSHINPNVPSPSGAAPLNFSRESLLSADVVDLEWRCQEWQAIVESYRELAQICLEIAAKHHQTAVRLTKENKALRERL